MRKAWPSSSHDSFSFCAPSGNKLPSPRWKPSDRMSLQWAAVATFLYAEVFLVLLLCIPFISPKRYGVWRSRQASKGVTIAEPCRL